MLRMGGRLIASPALNAARNIESRALYQRLFDGIRVTTGSIPAQYCTLRGGGLLGAGRPFSTDAGSDKDKKESLDLGDLDREIERSLKQQAADGGRPGAGADFKQLKDERGSQRRDEREKMRKRMIGRANIGGDWELMNCETGEVQSSKDLAGNWLLIYFGFTHCPDICPEQIEKMVKVVDTIDEKKHLSIPILPLFLSVDPQRDSQDRVKVYCKEFSPKLRGYTGNKEQVEKVTRAFRVYYSQGPKTEQALKGGEDDYIVDHTVVMYLIDPDGQFSDYYGQNRDVDEIVNAIRAKQMKREVAEVKGSRSSLFSSLSKSS